MARKSVTPQAKPAESKFAPGPIVYPVASILLLIPCFWQSRLQAGDLASHIYNSWLTQLIERGQAPALSIVSQTTNVLFDLILNTLHRFYGSDAAQRISVALAVLVFAWGAFAFVSTVAKRRPWHVFPWIVALAYGFVFHIGFFNFYLGLGLCFWALALGWNLDPRRIAVAVPILALAYYAHALPVLWTIGVLAYLWLARRVGPKNQVTLLGGALCTIVVLRIAISAAMPTRWSLQQLILFTGVDQLWIFDKKYLLATAPAAILWIFWLRRLKPDRRSVTLQICAITAAGIMILPTGVLLPGYKHLLIYIAERMSLALGVCILALLAAVPARQYDRYVTVAVLALFFGLLFRDESRLNRFEDQMTAAVAQLPPMQRVISGIVQEGLRVNALDHMIDRVCIERCYSYANYEPSTAQFRVRVHGENPIVTASYADSFGMQSGRYEVKERDLPLYQLLADDNGQIQIRIPPAGYACGVSAVNLL